MLLSTLKHEWQLISRLSPVARALLWSTLLYDSVYPLLFVFINAFILRQTQDIVAVALYNAGSFVTLPLTFWANGKLIHPIGLRRLFQVGLVSQGIVVLLLFFIQFSGWAGLFLFGLLQGVAMGFYWANRNFLTLEATTDENRIYYTGLETVITTVCGVVVPLLVGVAIEWGDRAAWYSAITAYKVLGVGALGCLFGASTPFARLTLNHPRSRQVWVTHPSKLWQINRWQEAGTGFYTGIGYFLPTLLIFALLGREATLGTLQSSSALLGALFIYVVSRLSKPRHRVGNIWLVVGALLLIAGWASATFSVWAVTAYILFAGLAYHLIWLNSNPLSMRVIDLEEEGSSLNNYAYVCDRELFLNLGRLAGVVGFFGLITIVPAAALRLAPLMTAGGMVGVGITAWLLTRRLRSSY